MKTAIQPTDGHEVRETSAASASLSPAVLMLGLLFQAGLFVFLSFVMAGMVVPMP